MNNSKQRNLILSIINESNDHPTANEIYEISKKTIPNISLGTVYRNLNLLVEHEMIKTVKTNDNMERYDKIFNKHNHFICNKCNKVYDIFEENENKKQSINGHTILDIDITYSGICENCIKSLENNK